MQKNTAKQLKLTFNSQSVLNMGNVGYNAAFPFSTVESVRFGNAEHAFYLPIKPTSKRVAHP